MTKDEWNKYLETLRAQLRQSAEDGELAFVSTEIIVHADPRTGEEIPRSRIVSGTEFEGDDVQVARQKFSYISFMRALALAGRAEGAATAMEVWASAAAVRTEGVRPRNADDRHSALVVVFEHVEHGRGFSVCMIDDGPPRRLDDEWRILDDMGDGASGMFQRLLPEPWMREMPNLVAVAQDYCKKRLEAENIEKLYDRMEN